MSVQERNYFPELKRHVTNTASGSKVVSYTSDLGSDTPILTLIHGYPQSSYEWRYVAAKLKDRVSLFIPELPGYGISTPAKKNSRRDIAGALLEALQANFDVQSSNPRRVIIGGHDRGARISHRIAVSRKDYPALDIIGAMMLDIVPTKVQWDKFSNPAIAQGYFHWPLLANVETSVQLLKAYGGALWVRNAHDRLSGNEIGLQRIKGDGAYDVYAELFDSEETLRFTAEDYAAGAAPEYKDQAEDQEAGRKIDVPALVMFSKARLGAGIDVAEVWKDWVAPGVSLTAVGVGDGFGHYLPEEAHEQVVDTINGFLHSLNV